VGRRLHGYPPQENLEAEVGSGADGRSKGRVRVKVKAKAKVMVTSEVGRKIKDLRGRSVRPRAASGVRLRIRPSAAGTQQGPRP
jgi:hypothetical protein